MITTDLDLPAAMMCLIITLVPALTLLLLRLPGWVKAASVALLALQITVSLANYVNGWIVAPDAKTYYDQAVALSLGYDPRLFVAGKEAWPTLLSWLFDLSSPSPLIPLCLNAALCTFMVPLAHWLGEACREGAGVAAVCLLSVMPGWWLWGIVGLREPAVWLLSLVALACLVLAIRTEGLLPLLGFGLAVALFAWLRGPLAVILGAGGAAAFLVARRPSAQRLFALALPLAAVSVLAMRQLAQLSAFQEGINTAAQDQLSGSRTGFDVGNPLVVAGRIVTGPWPWELPQVGFAVAPDMIFLWFTLILATVGVRRIKFAAAPYALPALGILASLAATSGNYGTMIRLRTQAMIWLLPLLAAGWMLIHDARIERNEQRNIRKTLKSERIAPRRASHTSTRTGIVP